MLLDKGVTTMIIKPFVLKADKLNSDECLQTENNVHPTAKGAVAMYMQMLTDFPEIMN